MLKRWKKRRKPGTPGTQMPRCAEEELLLTILKDGDVIDIQSLRSFFPDATSWKRVLVAKARLGVKSVRAKRWQGGVLGWRLSEPGR